MGIGKKKVIGNLILQAKTIKSVSERLTIKKRDLRTTSGFAKLGGGVITQTVAGTKTAGDSPNCVRLSPQLRKSASTLYASGAKVQLADNDFKKRNSIK